jgi:putative spermidine/putrescine transport system permease protein
VRVTTLLSGWNEWRVALSRWAVERGFDRALWLAAPACVFVILGFVYPSIYGIVLSFQAEQSSGLLGNYAAFFRDPYYYQTIFNTFRIALPVALISVAAAVPLAVRMRGGMPGQRTVTTILVVPMTFGTVLLALALVNYLGPQGWLNRTLLWLGLVHQPLELVHNMWGVIIAQTISEFPLAFILTLSYISGINPMMEQAASTLGAGPWARFVRVTLPLLAPGLSIAFLLVFVAAFSVFPTAILLGNPTGDSRTIAVVAAQVAFQDYNYPLASAISVITAACDLVVVVLVLGLRGRLYRGSTTGGKG